MNIVKTPGYGTTQGLTLAWTDKNLVYGGPDGDGNFQDPGEWGYIEWVHEQGDEDNVYGYTIYRPEDVLTAEFAFLLQYENL